jgi:hypothetical protein
VKSLQRPEFSASGRIVVRRAITMGSRTYEAGQELSAADRTTLTPRQIGAFYTQGLIDTLPAVAVQQPVQQPARPQQQHQQHRR